MNFKEYLLEGKYVKSVDDKLADKVYDWTMKNVDAEKVRLNSIKQNELKEYIEKFIDALQTAGAFSHGSYDKDLDKNTAQWLINIMKVLELETSPMTLIKRFEKELTDFTIKGK